MWVVARSGSYWDNRRSSDTIRKADKLEEIYFTETNYDCFDFNDWNCFWNRREELVDETWMWIYALFVFQ
jgi:hypothetical protein